MHVRLSIALGIGLALAFSPAAKAAPLGLDDCTATRGVYQCSGLVETWDGVPLDTTVTLPSRRDRQRPLVALLIESIVRIARGLGIRTVAEFVEDAATLEAMRAAGVDYAQGYHVGQPFPVSDLRAYDDAREWQIAPTSSSPIP